MTKTDRWTPIALEHDRLTRDRRRRAVEVDAALHATGEPCDGCGEKARLSGGAGCTCRTGGAGLAQRCRRNAAALRDAS